MYKSYYLIYISIKEEGTVIFSEPHNNYNEAKNKISQFIEEYANKLNKKVNFMNKDEMEKLKINKKLDDIFYVRKKDSNAVIYSRHTIPGYIYDAFTLEKYAHVGINEVNLKINEMEHQEKLPEIRKDVTQEKNNRSDNEIKIVKREPINRDVNIHITNKERGTHVRYITELKEILKLKNEETQNQNRNQNEKNQNLNDIIEEKKIIKNEDKMSKFVSDLIQGKEKLKRITPPVERKLIL